MNNNLFNIFNIVTDPKGVVDRLNQRSSWLFPLAVVGAGTFLIGMANSHLLVRVVENSLPIGLPEEQAKQTLDSVLRYQKLGVYFSPLGIAIKWLALSALLFLSCIILDIKVKYKKLFALVSQCGYIIFIQDLMVFLIIRLKGDSVQSVNDLSPQLGLDLFLSDLSKPLMLILNYFSFINIIYIILLTIMLSILGKCSKVRAFAATIPIWLLPLIFSLVLLLITETR